ncbi:hypothetical protein B296_00010585 [Ensete ventricosum]|uniref:Uncharacterized protein n=1 Tax=Ensete ventricosum TaxID=4639 RepID=A0A427A331_ENSVE|nr:hypothetical protein B296_00010585 [Ensete ventricosum]
MLHLATTTIPKKSMRETPVPDPRESSKPDTRLEPTKPILEIPLEEDCPEKTIQYFKISQVPRLENSRADALAKSASADTIDRLPAILSFCRLTIATVETVTTDTCPD